MCHMDSNSNFIVIDNEKSISLETVENEVICKLVNARKYRLEPEDVPYTRRDDMAIANMKERYPAVLWNRDDFNEERF